MNKKHIYKATIEWTGNNGTGTDSYRNYERSHQIMIEKKVTIFGSSDPVFRGNNSKHNPEELFLSSLSACHMLWYLHLCSEAGVIVISYIDHATGILLEAPNGSGKFIEITLNPSVIVKETAMIEIAKKLHKTANKFCFIANSLNFQIKHVPTTTVCIK